MLLQLNLSFCDLIFSATFSGEIDRLDLDFERYESFELTDTSWFLSTYDPKVPTSPLKPFNRAVFGSF